MSLIADGFLLIAAVVAAGYCIILSRRLARLNGLDGGLGAAIVSLSERVDAMNAALAETKRSTERAAEDLTARTALAGSVAERLEGLLGEAARGAQPEDARESEAPAEDVNASDRNFAARDPMTEADADADDALDLIRASSGAEEDEAFAMRLIEALAPLQPGERASA